MFTSGVFDSQISDHVLVYAILRLTIRKICTRSYKNFDNDDFQRDLQNVPFQVDEIDDKVYVFDTLYSDIVIEHAPIKQFHLRGNQVPYMSEQWRKAIRYRNRLWKNLCVNALKTIIKFTKNKEIYVLLCGEKQ